MPSASVPSFEDEKSCQQKKQKTDRVVPFQPFFEVKRRKDCKNRKGNNFLHDFKLRGGKIVMTDAVGGQYSKKAIPQLARITIHRAADLYLRWPYQAKIMKIFETTSSTIG